MLMMIMSENTRVEGGGGTDVLFVLPCHSVCGSRWLSRRQIGTAVVGQKRMRAWRIITGVTTNYRSPLNHFR